MIYRILASSTEEPSCLHRPLNPFIEKSNFSARVYLSCHSRFNSALCYPDLISALSTKSYLCFPNLNILKSYIIIETRHLHFPCYQLPPFYLCSKYNQHSMKSSSTVLGSRFKSLQDPSFHPHSNHARHRLPLHNPPPRRSPPRRARMPDLQLRIHRIR